MQFLAAILLHILKATCAEVKSPRNVEGFSLDNLIGVWVGFDFFFSSKCIFLRTNCCQNASFVSLWHLESLLKLFLPCEWHAPLAGWLEPFLSMYAAYSQDHREVDHVGQKLHLPEELQMQHCQCEHRHQADSPLQHLTQLLRELSKDFELEQTKQIPDCQKLGQQ